MTTAGHQCGGKALLVRDDGRQRACSCSLPSGGPSIRKRQCQFVHRPLCSGSVPGRLNLQKFDKHYLFIDLFSYHLHHQGSGFCTFPGARFYLHSRHWLCCCCCCFILVHFQNFTVERRACRFRWTLKFNLESRFAAVDDYGTLDWRNTEPPTATTTTERVQHLDKR
ncbi:hypothetical protein Tsp_05862 [Trichinella spiralis]|uniref:hypothetical protein n=1 Tax=Trichinella spiralis TaxID=6334 RepID=UPI0001EFC5B7|nr:hypothetical protein Tsp_05862 [Trichinella spiralis]